MFSERGTGVPCSPRVPWASMGKFLLSKNSEPTAAIIQRDSAIFGFEAYLAIGHTLMAWVKHNYEMYNHLL